VAKHRGSRVRDRDKPAAAAARSQVNRQVFTAANVEAHYTVEVVCRSSEEAAHPFLAVARAVSGRTRLAPHRQRRYSRYVKGLGHSQRPLMAVRNDSALEQIVGRLSLEPYVSAATWQIDRAIMEV